MRVGINNRAFSCDIIGGHGPRNLLRNQVALLLYSLLKSVVAAGGDHLCPGAY